MIIAYFYYTGWPQALAALPAETRSVWTGPGTDGYWAAFAARWGTGHDLVTIEQDVLIHDQVIPGFAACGEPWCEFPWQVTPVMLSDSWLGATRFTAALQAAVPASELCRPNPAALCARCAEAGVPCHRHLDVIFPALREHLGQGGPHRHLPPVQHLR